MWTNFNYTELVKSNPYYLAYSFYNISVVWEGIATFSSYNPTHLTDISI